MKQVELGEEEMTDLRMGADDRLLGSGQGFTNNSSVLFEAVGQQQSPRPRWSPLRWSREAEGGPREEEREVQGRARGDENASSGVVWLEVNDSDTTVQMRLQVLESPEPMIFVQSHPNLFTQVVYDHSLFNFPVDNINGIDSICRYKEQVKVQGAPKAPT